MIAFPGLAVLNPCMGWSGLVAHGAGCQDTRPPLWSGTAALFRVAYRSVPPTVLVANCATFYCRCQHGHFPAKPPTHFLDVKSGKNLSWPLDNNQVQAFGVIMESLSASTVLMWSTWGTDRQIDDGSCQTLVSADSILDKHINMLDQICRPGEPLSFASDFWIRVWNFNAVLS